MRDVPDPDQIPDDAFGLTEFIQVHYSRLKSLKKRGVGEMGPWLDRLGEAICKGILVERLSPRELGAAIFAVNRLHHEGIPEATTMKMHLQRVLVTKHHGACRMKYVKGGPRGGTYLLTVSVWETHVPASLVPAAEPRKRKRFAMRRPPVRALNVYHAR